MNSKRIRRVAQRLKRVLGEDGVNFASHFNTPVRFKKDRWYVNERIVELPYIFQQMVTEAPGTRVLEFGCSRSTLALSLASLGYRVTGVDLRPYPCVHPRLTIHQGDVLELKDDARFSVITSVSVLEHVGLGAYGEAPDQEALDHVISKLVSLLKPEGKMIVTVPIGRSHTDHFSRSFAPAQFKQLFARVNLELADESYFCRQSLQFWSPCSEEEVAMQDNSRGASGPSGVNGVGCFVWKKPARVAREE